MELANVTLVEELSSSDPSRQIGGLLSLIQQFNMGLDIQSYLGTLTQNVLKKSSSPIVRRLCYHALRGCSISSKHDWDFITKAVVDDITNYSSKSVKPPEPSNSKSAPVILLEPLIEVTIAALRAIAALFPAHRLQMFFNSHKAAFEMCFTPTTDYRIRLEAINVLKAIIVSSSSTLSLQSSLPSSTSTSASTSLFVGQSMTELFGDIVLRALLDDSHSVSFTAFELLRVLICSTSAASPCCAYFYQEKLPITITKENDEWLRFMSKHYSMLLARVHSMELNTRYPALRPLTYMTLMDEQLVNKTDNYIAKEQVSIFVSNVIRPMLSSVECGVLMEAVHCILLISFNANSEITTNSNYIEDAMNACLLLLDRAESASSYADIMKDICAVIDSVRDKYCICVRLLEHVHQIQDDVNRVYILSVIFRTLIQTTMNTKLSVVLKGGILRVNEDSDVDMIGREIFFKRCFATPTTPMERNLRHEMLFCLCREFLSLQPPVTATNQNQSNSTTNNSTGSNIDASMRSWLCVGLEICEMCRTSLTWEADTPVYCIMEFGKALTKLCVETFGPPEMANSEERKLVHKILCHVFHSLSSMRSETARVIAVCILSSYLQLNMNIAGAESGDIVFDHIRLLIRSFLARDTIEKQTVDTLTHSLLYICMRFSLKLKDAQLFLRQTLESRRHRDETYDSFHYALKKVDYCIKHNIAASTTNVSSHVASDLIILFGKPFHESHPIFKANYTDLDFLFLRNYIKAFQLTKEVYLNQHSQTAFAFLSSIGSNQQQSSSNTVEARKHAYIKVPRAQTIAVKNPMRLHHSATVSHPSDPLFVSAGYVLYPRECILVLRVSVVNESRIDMSDVNVQIGVVGALELFDQERQTSHFIGELGGNGDNAQEITRQFLVREWTAASFTVTVFASPKTAREGDASNKADILSSSAGNARDDSDLVTIRCMPMQIKLLHLLTPAYKLTDEDFMSCWESFHSAFHARIRIDSKSNNISKLSTAAADNINDNITTERRLVERTMKSRPFYRVTPISDSDGSKSSLPTVNTFQLCFACKTIFYDDILLVVTGSRYASKNVCVSDWEFRAASEKVMNVIRQNSDKFLAEIIGDQSHILRILHPVAQESESVDVFTSVDRRVVYNITEALQISSVQQVQLMLSHWAQQKHHSSH